MATPPTLNRIPIPKRIELVIRSVYEGDDTAPGGTTVIPDSIREVQVDTPPGGWTALADIDSPDGRDTIAVTYSPSEGYSDVVQGAGEAEPEDDSDRTDAATYKPPAAAQGNARKVLEWREKYGDAVKGMTAVGWARARQLASGEPISLDTVKRMAQFNRHRSNYEKARAKQQQEGGNPWEYAGIVAFLGWGGTTGVDWARGISERADADDHADATFTDKELHSQAVAWAKRTFNVWPSAYASAGVVRRYRKLYQEKHGSTEGAFRDDWLDLDGMPGLVHVDDLDADDWRDDDLGQWFNEEWVRISASGEILGPCGDRSEGEGKPKCLPKARAQAMTKAERAAAVRRKRAADPDPDRQGKARMVATKGDAVEPDAEQLVLLAVSAIYEQSNWKVEGIENLEIFDNGLTVEVEMRNTDNGDRVKVKGEYDKLTGFYSDVLISEGKADEGWREDAKKKGGGRKPGKLPNCNKGRPCGRSCIAKTKNCRIQPTGAVAQALNQAVDSGGGAAGESFNGTPLAVFRLENRLRNQRFESLAAFDAGGNQIFFKDGAKYEVALSDADIAVMRGGIVTHNHPRGWEFPANSPMSKGSSFSPEDLIVAAAADLAEMRAVSPGYRHSIKRPARGWPTPDTLEYMIRQAEDAEKIQGRARINAAANQSQAINEENAVMWHNVSTAVAKRIGAIYEREDFELTPWEKA